MDCHLSEQELWSGLDRNAPEIVEHVNQCGTCQTRATQFRAGIEAVAQASLPPMPPLPAKIGPYVIRRRLGQGGMGIVYEGEQQTPKRLVAIKVVRGGQHVDEYRVALFQREAQTLARLRHPAIAAIYEAGRTDDGQHFFAMELVRGVPLNDYVRERQVLRLQRLELFRKVCTAINYAHQRGVIHRDLKPTNVLVDPEGNPKILDFGLARITDPDATLRTVTHDVCRIMGTLPYMSPEEARGNPDEIDVRADVYSLGVILYELMTDQLPYTVKSAALHDAVRIICEEPPRRPGAIDRAIRGDLETIVLKAIEKEPGRRYQSAAALSEDVERYLNDQPIMARRASALYQLRKFVIRHRLYVTLAVAFVLLGGGARLWIDHLDASRRAYTELLSDLQALEVAVIEAKLAHTLYLQHRFNEAEPHYRNALSTFRRLQRDDHTVPAMLALADLLIHREDPSDNDYESAEGFLLDALAIAEANPGKWRAEMRQAFENLRALYGDEVWDDTDLLAEVEAKLKALEATSAPSDQGSQEPAMQK